MTQFEGLEFRPVTLPFVSSLDKAQEAVRRINRAAEEEGLRPIVFSTLVQDELREIVVTANALFLDLFSTFVGPLERELNTRSTHRAGRAHGMADLAAYTTRINATNFALANDDGSGGDYALADVVLIGVSRVGKTPTCLYLALQYGVFAANYPLTEDDLEAGRLPPRLEPFRSKLYEDRKSTRLNSSHSQISYAVFCLKKKKIRQRHPLHDEDRQYTRLVSTH